MTMPEGYTTDPGHDPAEDHIGPFYYRKDEAGFRYAFLADERHCNVVKVVHGGVLMTFADFAASMEATNNYDGEDCVTISFSSEFVSAGPLGSLIEAECEVTRKTRAMAFVRGKVMSGDNVLLTFSSVMKRLPHDQ